MRLSTLLLLSGIAALTAADSVAAQPVFSGDATFEGLPLGARNGSSNLAVEGGRLYSGPLLIFTDDGETFTIVDDPAFEPNASGRVTIFSMDVEGDVIWTGLGFVDRDADDEQAAAGFAFSEDGGQTWTYRFPQLDAQDDDTVVYGISTLTALPVIVPQQSPPFDIDYDPVTGDVWMAGFASGVRRSSDNGATWDRIVLPPDTSDGIDPQTPYDFDFAPIRGGVQQNGFLGFSVLVDEAGTVWAGTAAGVSRSDTSDIDPATGDRAWRRFAKDGTDQSIAGNFVVSIEEQPIGDPAFPVGSPENPRNPVWIIGWPADDPSEELNVTVWLGDDENGDPIFEPKLLTNARIFDTAFHGSTVYVVGFDGLYISENGGDTWRTITTFRDAQGNIIPIDPNSGVFSVAVVDDGTTDGVLWAGHGDGLMKSTDGGGTWTAFRVNVPTNPATPTEAVPTVDAYAYPNPFTPGVDGYCRIHLDLTAAGTANLRIFDFGMQLVRELEAPVRAGANEILWDGLTDGGTRIANGTYFYVVDVAGREATGKILVLR
ncbi:MAG: hypothetical protein IH855_09440 [Bacteroidetes bacterium]|nr:hypothetical protein [Bacteroidota bacterium]